MKLAATELGVATIQPPTLRDEFVVAQIAGANPDILLVFAYGEILRKALLTLTPLGCVNVHPSLLPMYRGAAPIPAAIQHGDVQTGVSFMRLVRQLDAGPILSQVQVDVMPRDSTALLTDRLGDVAAKMLPDVLLRYAAGELQPIPQDDALATYTREWTTEDARIRWNLSAVEIDRWIRAADPWPIAWTVLNGVRVRVLEALPTNNAPDLAPGELALHDRRVLVGTRVGALELITVQPAGKRAMPATDWWRGLRVDRATFEP